MTTEEKKSEYYAAVLIFESRCPAPDDEPLYEEQIVLIRATSAADAEAKAKAYAKTEEISYQNGYGEMVTISTKRLLEVTCSMYVPEAIDQGSEVYGRYFRDYAAYEAFEPLLKGQQL